MASRGELGRYRVITPLGAGGMASVVLAEDVVLERKVALKRLTGSALLGGDRQQSLSRLKREALLGASVTHPNLVAVYDVVATPEQDLVIVMEYVEGETLGERLRRESAIAPQQALPILQGVAAALDAIHARGVVHRDVKPANVLLGSDGRVKLADLGIAAASDRTQITNPGALLGTFRYMAPEQLEDRPATPAIDIYALAAMAFEVLCGRPARQEPNPLAIAHAIANQPPPDLREAWPGAPPAAAGLLAQAMSRDPADRPASAVTLIADLRRSLGVDSRAAPVVLAPRTPARAEPTAVPPRSAARPPAPPPERRRGALWLAGLLLGAGVVTAVVLGLNGAGSPSRGSGLVRSSGSGTGRGAGTQAGGSGTGRGAGTQAGRSGTGRGAGTQAGGPSASTGGNRAASSSPVTAVQSFYHLAAAHDYPAAWALADPSFRTQLGGYASFEGGQSGDRSITFNQASVTERSALSATVAIQTTSVRDSGTQHCSGTVELLPGSSGGDWLLHQIHINCR